MFEKKTRPFISFKSYNNIIYISVANIVNSSKSSSNIVVGLCSKFFYAKRRKLKSGNTLRLFVC